MAKQPGGDKNNVTRQIINKLSKNGKHLGLCIWKSVKCIAHRIPMLIYQKIYLEIHAIITLKRSKQYSKPINQVSQPYISRAINYRSEDLPRASWVRFYKVRVSVYRTNSLSMIQIAWSFYELQMLNRYIDLTGKSEYLAQYLLLLHCHVKKENQIFLYFNHVLLSMGTV